MGKKGNKLVGWVATNWYKCLSFGELIELGFMKEK